MSMKEDAGDLYGDEPHFIGLNMRDVENRIRFLARKMKSLLFIGESGTGKNLAADIVADELKLPMHEVTLSMIIGEVGYTELFGYQSGAFTGADKKGKDGSLIDCGGAICFLNEIASCNDVEIQMALLRFLERQEIIPRGGSHANPVRIETYIIGASMRSSELDPALIRRFDEVIELPPLAWRARRSKGIFIIDIAELV